GLPCNDPRERKCRNRKRGRFLWRMMIALRRRRMWASAARNALVASSVHRAGIGFEKATQSLRVNPVKPQIEAAGKLNALRTAFEVGVKTPQIARQFGLSQADLRKASASNGRRTPTNG